LIEVTGGRVVFPGPDDNTATSIWADLGEGNIGIVVVMPQSEENGTLSFVAPEPVGQDRVFALVPSKDPLPTIHDITRAVRQSFGGFSVVAFETVKGRSGELFSPPIRSLKAYANT
jgi:hypothetical protein